MNKFKEMLITTDLAIWRKKGLLCTVILVSFFPFFITYVTSREDIQSNVWALRHFVLIAVMQAIAQISIVYYILKNNVPNYLVLSFMLMMLFFQLTFGITVILIIHA